MLFKLSFFSLACLFKLASNLHVLALGKLYNQHALFKSGSARAPQQVFLRCILQSHNKAIKRTFKAPRLFVYSLRSLSHKNALHFKCSLSRRYARTRGSLRINFY